MSPVAVVDEGERTSNWSLLNANSDGEDGCHQGSEHQQSDLA